MELVKHKNLHSSLMLFSSFEHSNIVPTSLHKEYKHATAEKAAIVPDICIAPPTLSSEACCQLAASSDPHFLHEVLRLSLPAYSPISPAAIVPFICIFASSLLSRPLVTPHYLVVLYSGALVFCVNNT